MWIPSNKLLYVTRWLLQELPTTHSRRDPTSRSRIPRLPKPICTFRQLGAKDSRISALSDFLGKVLEIDDVPFGVLTSDRVSFFKAGAPSKVLL